MSTEKAKWKQTLSSPVILLLLAVWLTSSYLLWKTWKDGAPFPLGMGMPF